MSQAIKNSLVFYNRFANPTEDKEFVLWMAKGNHDKMMTIKRSLFTTQRGGPFRATRKIFTMFATGPTMLRAIMQTAIDDQIKLSGDRYRCDKQREHYRKFSFLDDHYQSCISGLGRIEGGNHGSWVKQTEPRDFKSFECEEVITPKFT